MQGNNHGLECLRLLNEIICDFDSILDDERFKAVDKIKTIGSTYMAAIGLFPHYELPSSSIEPQADAQALPFPKATAEEPNASDARTINQATPAASLTPPNGSCQLKSNCSETTETTENRNRHHDDNNLMARRDVARYLQILVRFVLEMKARLQDINEHSYNNFKLRVGINLGPVIAGVIGASKPQYDIWGNTVNVASRMESTAEANRIQITEEVYQILKDFNQDQGFQFTCRGSVNVKGKGFMTTYYLDY